MCDEAVNDILAALKLVFDLFVTNKVIKKFSLLCMQIKIYSILMNIPVMLCLIIMKWVLLILILITSILIIILTQKIYYSYYYSYQTFGLAYKIRNKQRT